MDATQTAPCVVMIDGRGVCTLEIEDHTAEVHSYSVEPAAALWDEAAFALTRLDGKGDSPHRVAVNLQGRWRCGCASFRFRKGPHAPRGCIHTNAVSKLYLFLRRLMPAESQP